MFNKFLCVSDGDTILWECYDSLALRLELIEMLNENEVLQLETLHHLPLNALIDIAEIELECEIKEDIN